MWCTSSLAAGTYLKTRVEARRHVEGVKRQSGCTIVHIGARPTSHANVHIKSNGGGEGAVKAGAVPNGVGQGNRTRCVCRGRRHGLVWRRVRRKRVGIVAAQRKFADKGAYGVELSQEGQRTGQGWKIGVERRTTVSRTDGRIAMFFDGISGSGRGCRLRCMPTWCTAGGQTSTRCGLQRALGSCSAAPG